MRRFFIDLKQNLFKKYYSSLKDCKSFRLRRINIKIRTLKKSQYNLNKTARLKMAALLTLWLLLAVAGLGFISKYENTPGIAATPFVQFPAASQIKRVAGLPTLVMVVHPHCPCTRASMGELELLMAQTQGRATTYVLFLKPADFTDDWEKTDLWQTASEIPGVEVVQDKDGKEAELFNAATSGQTFLYDADGQLIFKGGITLSRGHSGDNAGRSAIVALLNGDKAEQTETAVYGCPMFNKKSECPMPQ